MKRLHSILAAASLSGLLVLATVQPSRALPQEIPGLNLPKGEAPTFTPVRKDGVLWFPASVLAHYHGYKFSYDPADGQLFQGGMPTGMETMMYNNVVYVPIPPEYHHGELSQRDGSLAQRFQIFRNKQAKGGTPPPLTQDEKELFYSRDVYHPHPWTIPGRRATGRVVNMDPVSAAPSPFLRPGVRPPMPKRQALPNRLPVGPGAGGPLPGSLPSSPGSVPSSQGPVAYSLQSNVPTRLDNNGGATTSSPSDATVTMRPGGRSTGIPVHQDQGGPVSNSAATGSAPLSSSPGVSPSTPGGTGLQAIPSEQTSSNSVPNLPLPGSRIVDESGLQPIVAPVASAPATTPFDASGDLSLTQANNSVFRVSVSEGTWSVDRDNRLLKLSLSQLNQSAVAQANLGTFSLLCKDGARVEASRTRSYLPEGVLEPGSLRKGDLVFRLSPGQEPRSLELEGALPLSLELRLR